MIPKAFKIMSGTLLRAFAKSQSDLFEELLKRNVKVTYQLQETIRAILQEFYYNPDRFKEDRLLRLIYLAMNQGITAGKFHEMYYRIFQQESESDFKQFLRAKKDDFFRKVEVTASKAAPAIEPPSQRGVPPTTLPTRPAAPTPPAATTAPTTAPAATTAATASSAVPESARKILDVPLTVEFAIASEDAVVRIPMALYNNLSLKKPNAESEFRKEVARLPINDKIIILGRKGVGLSFPFVYLILASPPLFFELLEKNINVAFYITTYIEELMSFLLSKEDTRKKIDITLFNRATEKIIDLAATQTLHIPKLKNLLNTIQARMRTESDFDLRTALALVQSKIEKLIKDNEEAVEVSEETLLSAGVPKDVIEHVLKKSDPFLEKLKTAITMEKLFELKKTLESRKDSLHATDEAGYTPLLFAVYVNKIESVKYLLKELQEYIDTTKKLKESAQRNIVALEPRIKKLKEELTRISQNDESIAQNYDRYIAIPKEIQGLEKDVTREKEKIEGFDRLLQAKTQELNRAYRLAQFVKGRLPTERPNLGEVEVNRHIMNLLEPYFISSDTERSK